MTERAKKIVFAVFFVAFSVGMGYGLYVLFFRARAPQVAPPTGAEITGKLPSAGAGVPQPTPTPEAGGLPQAEGVAPEAVAPQAPSNVRLLRDSVTQAVVPSADGSGARFYNPEDGRFYRVNADGSITLLGEKQFFNVEKVGWGNKNDEAILEFPDGSNVFYDFAEKRQVVLPKHWEEFEFAPDDNRVASKSVGLDPENRFLIVSNPDGTEARAIEQLGTDPDQTRVSWSPSGQIVAYHFTGESVGGNELREILLVGQNHERFGTIVAPGEDFLPNWSPSGKQIMFSVWNASSFNKPNLWVTSADTSALGRNRRNLNIQTWADKCVWTSDAELLCGVPQGLPDNAGLQRSGFSTLPDDLYRINLTTGASTKISTPGQNYPISNPVLNRDKTKLIFSDAETGKLYSYDLK